MIVRRRPDSLEKLAQPALRTKRAFVLDGAPLMGVSVFLALADSGEASVDGILAGRMISYRIVHTSTVARIREAGFGLVPSFGRPHYTLVVPDASAATIEALATALGPGTANPYHVVRRRR